MPAFFANDADIFYPWGTATCQIDLMGNRHREGRRRKHYRCGRQRQTFHRIPHLFDLPQRSISRQPDAATQSELAAALVPNEMQRWRTCHPVMQPARYPGLESLPRALRMPHLPIADCEARRIATLDHIVDELGAFVLDN